MKNPAPKSTRSVNNWSMRLFFVSDRPQEQRGKPVNNKVNLLRETSEIQDLQINVSDMTEPLNFCLRLPYTFRGVSRLGDVARPV